MLSAPCIIILNHVYQSIAMFSSLTLFVFYFHIRFFDDLKSIPQLVIEEVKFDLYQGDQETHLRRNVEISSTESLHHSNALQDVKIFKVYFRDNLNLKHI